jgi:hypothetical protein
MTNERDMGKKAMTYTKGEIGRFRVIKNFLPPPGKLVTNYLRRMYFARRN